MKRIFLYGPPASGKTTLGRLLAGALKVDFCDLDEEIEKSTGRTVSEIFAADGEDAFRALECARLRDTSASVVALGGGTLLDDSNRRWCEANGIVVCIDTPKPSELERRFFLTPGKRPLGDMAAERAAHYASFTRRICRFDELNGSLVVIGRGFAAESVAGLPTVKDAAVDMPDAQVVYTIPSESTEIHKTIETVSGIWSAFAAAGIGRKDTVVAIGGGVTGDLTGFAAATWMRGVDWINVPTTLLAMVDASVGGKTGCDLPEGKNLVGAFHAPRLVLIDTDFLKSLPSDRLADGMAEMIKHRIISPNDGVTLQSLISVCPPSAATIAGNLEVKIGIVREDPFETKGRRLLLNCGHTVAHAVEKLTDYAVSHGAAVAIGCVEEARLAVKLGLAKTDWPEELASVFAAAKLPTTPPDGLTFEIMKPVMRGDKKRAGDTVFFALPCGWGDVRAVPIEL